MSTSYLLRRLGQLVPTVALIVSVTFLLLHLAPGDPVVALAGEHGDEAYYAAMRARFGLDQPVPRQFVTYLGNVLRGNLGTSYAYGRPAVSVVLERLPATLLLAGAALAFSTMAGMWLGVLAARRHRHPLDLGLRTVGLVGYATPNFWLAQVAVITLALGLGLFPVQGISDARSTATGLSHVLDVLHHLALPVLVLGTSELAMTMRLVRTGMLETIGLDYIRTARAKGLTERRVAWHALRNVLIPVATVTGARIGMFFTGAVLVEVVFAWPGVGRLLLAAAQARDMPVLLAIFLLVSLGVVLANLLTDLVYGWLDPRVTFD